MKPNNEKGGKKSMYKQSKRFLAGFLAFLLVVTMIPTDLLGVVYAAEAVETVEDDADVPESTIADDDAEEAEVLENADADDDADAEEVLDENDIVKDGESAGASEPEKPEGGDSSEAPEASQPASDPQPSEPASTTPEPSEPESTPTQPIVQPKNYILNASNVAAQTVSADGLKAGSDNYFTITDKIVIEDNSKKFTINGTETTITRRMKTGGDGSASERSFKFTIHSGMTADITVCVSPSTSGKTATLGLFEENGNVSNTSAVAAGATATVEWKGITEGTYYIAGKKDPSDGANCNIYYVGVNEKELVKTKLQSVTLSNVDDKTYTGEEIKPTITVTDENGASVAAAGYMVTYARGTGNDGTTAPGDSAYVEDTDFDFTSAGTIFVKVVGKGLYDGKLAPVSYTIKKKALDKEQAAYGVDTTQAAEGAATIDCSIDLNELFGIAVSETVTYSNPTIASTTADQNVLASDPQLSIEGTTLKFISVASLADGTEAKPADIEITSDFANYTATKLTVTINLVEKTKLTFESVTAPSKTYDGEAVAFDSANVVLKNGTETVTNITLDVVFTAKDGTALDEAPVDAGEYVLIISVPETNMNYSGKLEVPFEITKKELQLKAADRNYIKGYGKTPDKIEQNSLYYNYTELNDALVGTTLNDLLKNVDINLTYKSGETEVTDWTTVAEGELTIVPSMSIKSGETVDATVLDNYDVVAVNGKLTVLAEEAALADGVHELNLTKNWFAKGSGWVYGSADATANTDGYFTVTAEPKSAGTGNATPLMVYDKYTNVAKMKSAKNVSFTTTKANAKTEFIAVLPDGGSVTVGNNTISVNGDTITPATGTTALEGTVVYPTKDTPVLKMVKAEVTLGAAGNYSVSGDKEFQLLYVKVTEGDVAPAEPVSITPTISDPDNKLNGAKVYFTATGETDVEAGTTAVTLKKGVTYTLVVKNADGSVSTTLEAKINGSLSYTPSEDGASVTITIEDKGVNPPVPDKKVKITPTISDPDKVLGEATVVFVNSEDKTDRHAVTSGQELELTVGVTYRLAILDAPEDVNLSARIGGSNVYTVPEDAASVTIDIAVVPVVKYKVTLTDETGKELKVEEVEEGKEFTFPDATSTKEGYFFAGWASEDSDRAYGKGETYTVEYDITFKETWTQAGKEDLTVKFYDYTESEIPSLAKTIKAGESPVITLPEAYSKRVGYTFEGWSDSEYGNTYKAGATYTVKSNVTFYEYWEEEDIPETGMVIRVDEEETSYQGGKAVTPYVYVYYKGNELTLGTDYTVTYKNNKNAGTATVTVTGKNNYAKAVKKDVQFTIRPRWIDDLDYADEMTVIKDAKFTPVIMCNGKALKAGKDYTLSDANKDSGFDAAKCRYTKVTDKAGTDEQGNPTPAKYNTLVLTGTGNYKGTAEIQVTVIDKSEAKALGVEIDKTFKPTYGDNLTWGEVFGEKQTGADGKEEFKVGKVKVFDKKDSAKTALVRNTDFMIVDVSGSINSAGTYKFMVVGMGAYSGSVTKSIKVAPKKATDIKAGVEEYDPEKSEWVLKTTGLTAVYRSYGATLPLTVRREYEVTEGTNKYTRTETLYRGWDYKVSYSGNKKVGNAKAKISFINDYKGTAPITVDFAITGDSLNNVYAIAPDMVYSKAGKSYVSKPIVEYNSTILKASEYTVSYEWASASDIKIDTTTGAETGYTADDKVKVTIKEGDTYAIVKATIKPSAKSNFVLTNKDAAGNFIPKTITYYVRKADNTNAIDLSKAKVTFYSDPECKTQLKKIPFRDVEFWTPEGNVKPEEADESAIYVKVEVNKAVVDPKLYDVTWLCAQNKGKATVVITGKGPSETTVTPADPNPQAEEGSGSTTPASTKFAVGGKTATVAIDSIGAWIEPKTVAEKAKNLLKNLF